MNCQHFLKKLDAVFPGSEDHEDPGVREAVAHAAECENCAKVFQSRQEFDRRVAMRLLDVPVPGEASERLLMRLNQADGATPAAPPAVLPWPSIALPKLPTFAAAAAVVFAVAVGWYLNSDSNVTMTMDEVQDAVGEQFAVVGSDQFAALDEFNGEFDPSIEDGRWKAVTSATPRGIDLNGDGVHDAAAYRITGPVAGVLLVLSPDLVTDPPIATSPMGAVPEYSPVRVAWLPAGGSRVHLCVLTGDDDRDIDRLLRNVINSRAA